MLPLLIISTIVLTNCSGGKSGNGEAPKTEDIVRDTRYNVQISGNNMVKFAGVKPIRFLTVTGGDSELAQNRLLSLGPPDPINQEGQLFRVTLDIVGYSGNGTYELPANPPGQGTSNSLSNVMVQLWTSPDVNAPIKQYKTRLETCKVKVRKDGRSGMASCPKLTGPPGETLSVKLAWG